MIEQMVALSRVKKEELDHIKKGEDMAEVELKEKKKSRCNFLDQLLATRLRAHAGKKRLLNECVMGEEARISELMDQLDSGGEQMGFLEALGDYLERIDVVHCKLVLKEVVRDSGLAW